MASRQDARFLEESSRSADSTSTILAFSAADFTESSPPILEPSKDGSRADREGRKQKRPQQVLARSLPLPRTSASDTATLVSNGQLDGRSIEQSVDLPVQEPRTNCCTTLCNSYKNSVIKFRNSAFMYIVQLLFASIPLSAIVMGTLFHGDCKKARSLPLLGLAIGVLGIVFMIQWVAMTFRNRRAEHVSSRRKTFFLVSGLVVCIMTVIDAVLVYCLLPSFDSESDDYCNGTFYTYAFYKNIATIVVVVLSAIIYAPGSRHTVCCEQCSRRSPLSQSASYYAF